VAAFLGEDYYVAQVNQGDHYLNHVYRRLYEGNIVAQNQMVALVNPAKALGELQMARRKVSVAIQEEIVAASGHKTAYDRLVRAERLKNMGSSAAEEYEAAVFAERKYLGDHIIKKEAIKEAEDVRRNKEIDFRRHEIRDRIPVQRCQIQRIYRFLNEAVNEKDPVLELWNIERLLAEALVPVKSLQGLSVSRITVEPVEEMEPVRTLHGHIAAINAVAVAGDEKNPLILSASEDKKVLVWKPKIKGPIGVLDHLFPVRAVAATLPGAETHYWLSGDSDGKVYYWKLNQDSKPTKIELKKEHKDAITSLAISPDGKYFASGGADGKIFLYNAGDEPKERYPFVPKYGVKEPHQGPVTSLTFTPPTKDVEGRLISASLDETLRVWKLLENGVVLHKMVEKRAGTVSQLGVSADGAWMLFDKGKDLQILSALDGETTINTLSNPDGSVPFETLALFSRDKDATMLLTAGAREGRLQLWRTPTESERGYEIRQLVPRERGQTVSCAAFSSYPGLGANAPFVVSGTKDGYVYLWSLPTNLGSHRVTEAHLHGVAQEQDASGQIRVRVEVLNPATPDHPKGRFRPGQPVTIVFE